MKKILVLFVSVATLVGLFAGCGSKPEPEPLGSGITGEEILSNMEALLEQTGGQFLSTRLPVVDLEDGRESYPLLVTETIAGQTYHIHVQTKDGWGRFISLSSKKGSRTNIEFALLSMYLYDSLNLPEREAQEFYDYFSLLTKEPSGEMSVEGWELWVSNIEDLLTFTLTYNPGDANN